MERVFFDWDEPFLPQAVRYLIDRHTDGGRLDLSNALIALPAKGALRRIETLLVAEAERRVELGQIDPDWLGPELMTCGRLPEALYLSKRPFAEPLTSMLAWRRAIAEMKSEAPRRYADLFPVDAEDSSTDLAELVIRPYNDLAAGGIDFQRVASSTFIIPQERARWGALADLQARYWAILDAAGLWDVQRARVVAVERRECRTEKSIYVAGAIDLNGIQKKMLEQVAERVTILVFSPENGANRYDAFGCVDPSKWEEAVFDIPAERIFKATTPVGAGGIAARLAETLQNDSGGEPLARRLTIGVADEEARPFIEQELAGYGISVDSAAGLIPTRNRVVRLLETTAKFLRRREFGPFAELVRFPDLERYLRRIEPSLAGCDWLSALDRHQRRYVPERLTARFGESVEEAPEDEEEERRRDRLNREALRTVCRTLERLFAPLVTDAETAPQISKPPSSPDDTGELAILDALDGTVGPDEVDGGDTSESIGSVLRRNGELAQALRRQILPSDWIAPVDGLISAIYPETDTAPTEEDRQIDTGIKMLHGFFTVLTRIPRSLAEPMTFDRLIDLLLRHLRSVRLPTPSSPDAVELLGWLDLALDDRPELILVGFCDEFVPSSRSADLFLPDRLRLHFALENNRTRGARDAAMLSSILASRPRTRFIFEQASLTDDPLRPSRFLLLTGEPEETARRTLAFFGNGSTPNPPLPPREPAARRARSAFQAPILRPSGPAPDSFPVSSFKTFLDSPYIWFLQQALRLERLADNASEWGPDLFGSLVHRALEAFGRDETAARSNDAEAIAAFLDRKIDPLAKRYAENDSAGTVRLQIEQARGRLRQFARWQAEWRDAGNEILFVESSPAEPYRRTLDGAPVTVSGKIDRIDFNRTLNRYFIFDYKTFDSVVEGGKDDMASPFEKLLNMRAGNLIDKKYLKYLPYPPPGRSDEEDADPKKKWRHWIDLQLPLYLPLARRMIAESGRDAAASCTAGYIALPKSGAVSAYAADWSAGDLAEADATFDWAIRTIRRLWREGVDPSAPIDPDERRRGILLPKALPPYLGDYAPITLT